MPDRHLQSHQGIARSVEQALDEVERRLAAVKPEALEHKLGCRPEQVLRALEAEPGAQWALRFTEPRQVLFALAEEAARTDFGRFLLCARGLNWRTTDLLFDPAYHAALRQQEREGTLGLFDKLAFFAFPLCLATRERFHIFQQQTQPLLARGALLGSLPCGRMRDLLTLDYASAAGRDVSLVGLDKDPDALQGAAALAGELRGQRPLPERIAFRLADGLRPGLTEPGIREEFDLLTSNGLTIYLSDEQCAAFYRSVHAALKPGGVFITSHILPPEEYRWGQINLDHWRLQAAILAVVIGALWEPLVKPREQVLGQLDAAGFRDLQVIPDSQGIFPTFVGRKPS